LRLAAAASTPDPATGSHPPCESAAGSQGGLMLGTSIPALMHFAKSHAMNPLAVGMIWTFAAAGKIFVYQSPVLIIGYSYGYFAARDLLRIGFWLTLAEGAILLVLVPYYWPWIGISF
jgi:di/tricarboxylate transporter